MQSIVSKGKDINDAIKLGLELLDSTKKEVNIEIIQQQTKGFLGIRSKEAIVKLTKRENSVSSSSVSSEIQVEDKIDLEQIVSDFQFEQMSTGEDPQTKSDINEQTTIKETDKDSLKGKVWVKNGQLYCQSSPTQFPLVTINDGIKLYKNNQRLNEKTLIISENDQYQIKVENEEKLTTWNITLDEERLRALLTVEPGFKMIRSIPDIDADHHIDLIVEETKEVHHALNYTDVIQRLESLRVKHGFNQDEIVKAMETDVPGTFEIARGKSPIPGKDGWIEFKVDTDDQDGLKEINGKVDYRDIKTIPTVERGRLIAVIHPPLPGEMGYTVTNEPLPAKQTLPIVLSVRNGAVVLEDKVVVSTKSGRPLIEKRGQLVKIAIMPKLTHVGNVDLISGNIRFMGDVEVFGEVDEKMVVEAEGDIMIHKSINFSTLTAKGTITTFGNVIGSEISAGKNNMLITELGHLLGIINQTIEKLIALVKQLTLSPAFKSNDLSRVGLQPLVKILLEKKFKSFPPLVKKYVENVRGGEDYLDDDVWRDVAVSLSQLFLSLTNEVTSLERIEQLSKKIKELNELSKTPVEPNSYITIPNVQNSSLYCSGNILIVGQGCINTKIHAGGILKINGIIRGGEVYGRLGVEINEVGSESRTPTIIAVPSDQIIRMSKVMEGTTVKIGNVKYTFKETRYDVKVRLDDNERIVLE